AAQKIRNSNFCKAIFTAFYYRFKFSSRYRAIPSS
ncbi:YitT, partial [Listeria seeligeri FSL S4-171]